MLCMKLRYGQPCKRLSQRASCTDEHYEDIFCHKQVTLRTRAADVRQASKATVAAVEAKDTAQMRVSAAVSDRDKAQSRLQEPPQVCKRR